MIFKRFFGVWLLVFFLVAPLAGSNSWSFSTKERKPNPLLTEICRYETRGLAHPEMAEGLVEKVGRLRQKPVGRCQIQEATARDLGYASTRRDLFRDEINSYWAQRYLDLIKHRLEHACGRRGATLRAIAYGYPHGHNALLCNPPVGTYHDQVALAVGAHRMQAIKVWNQNRRITLVRL